MRNRLANLLADYYRRRALGEAPAADDYRERAGDVFDEFRSMLEANAELDAQRDPSRPPALPLRFGSYTLTRELGRGAVGVVYEAVHRSLGRTVAIKILRTGFDTHPTALERFRREARACAQVRHPNIVEVFEASEVNGRPFYAMELVPGATLLDLRRNDALPSHRTLARGLAGVADALHTLHEAGIFHRDVKPSNIIVADDGRMMLADFGLARTMAAAGITKTGEALGTPLYMSPEQLTGERDKVDGRTDVYCLGASLYETLAKRQLFSAKNPGDMMRQILAERPDPPSRHEPDVPEALDVIVLRALEKRRRDRYPDAAALRDDLLAFAKGETPAAATRRRKTAPARGWMVAAAAVLVAAVGLAVWWTGRTAVLEINAIPVARIVFDGETHPTPFRREVKPGEWEFEVACDGFRPERRKQRLVAGQKHTDLFVLVPKDETDPVAVGRLAEAFGLTLAEPFEEPPSGERTVPSIPLALYPRGRVTPAEAQRLHIEFRAFDGKGRLFFTVDGETVFDEPYNEWDNTRWKDDVPAAVGARLRPGVKVAWGYKPDDGGEWRGAEFEVVADGTAARCDRIDEALGNRAPVAAAQLKAQVYFDAGRDVAAVREIAPLLEKHPRLPAGIVILDRALTRLELRDSRLGIHVQHAMRDLDR